MSYSRQLKMKQAMELLNVSRNTMRKYCEEGIVDATQIPAGKRMDWRISEDSCLALLSGSMQKITLLEQLKSLR
ncbi:helix-turn-helix domain-containing protein [Desulfovibrio mangrovi]|uniref:helix-turn-helix domain-containing protein n=1 Tax=Desulfovibrio mangrovi TaxID=2976983 RepID=UPI002246D190|nr:helix-turn-helix domain-containing protein [Desulfovibrio mangrovi]UZP68747.1 helix-turn-helix domain-containing protein [Desulfovibrio mangrovi]